MNDLFFAANGDLYFTDQGQTGLHDPTGRVYRYDTAGKLTMLVEHRAEPQRAGDEQGRDRPLCRRHARQRGVAPAADGRRHGEQGRAVHPDDRRPSRTPTAWRWTKRAGW